jgi:hypothetical protein
MILAPRTRRDSNAVPSANFSCTPTGQFLTTDAISRFSSGNALFRGPSTNPLETNNTNGWHAKCVLDFSCGSETLRTTKNAEQKANMRTSKHLTLLALAMLPLLSGFSQTANPPTPAPVIARPRASSDENIVATAVQAGVSHGLVLSMQRQLTSIDSSPSADIGVMTNLDVSSPVVPKSLDRDSSLHANRPFSFEAANLDLNTEFSAEPFPSAKLDERAFYLFESLDLNADGILSFDEWKDSDANAEAKDSFRVLDENGDGQVSLTEFLKRAPKHPALYLLFGNTGESIGSDFSWEKGKFQSQPQGLRLFSFRF